MAGYSKQEAAYRKTSGMRGRKRSRGAKGRSRGTGRATKCQVVDNGGRRRRICRYADGRIKSNTAVRSKSKGSRGTSGRKKRGTRGTRRRKR